ncbi:MAG: PadR family transcriptional regulator [Prevotella sp.]|jgi:PadR family transcriptional regulator PadR|nr:PadR family transcriptional regulator [Prevotella sp.]
MDNSGNFIRGAAELLILNLLLDGNDHYGYELSKLLASLSNGIVIPAGTLYPTLRRLADRGYIHVEQRIEEKRLRTYYHILDSGRDYCAALLKEYNDANQGIQYVLASCQKEK